MKLDQSGLLPGDLWGKNMGENCPNKKRKNEFLYLFIYLLSDALQAAFGDDWFTALTTFITPWQYCAILLVELFI